MRCLLCESLSLTHICLSCQREFLTPSLYTRELTKNIKVLSFYKYSDIKDLLHTKHTDLGYYIYSILAKNSLQKFAASFEYKEPLYSVAIDDKATHGYSHTALLNKALNSKNIKPLYNRLRATNSVTYSGKSKEFRLLNPRNFEVKNLSAKELILVDDIITTGSTLNQAVEAAKKHKNSIMFCLTLADASIN